MSRISFSKGFRWGVATAAHQVEGGLDHVNDYGLYSLIEGSPFVEPALNACEHYQRFEEDIAMLAGLGFDTYRFSIEWARIEPEEGVFAVQEIDHYRKVLACCRRYGITPTVTLHHFTTPRWLIAQGGWESALTPQFFARYANRVALELGDVIRGRPEEAAGNICTLNEANTGRLNHIAQGHPDDRRQAPWVGEAARALGTTIDAFTPWTFASSPAAVRVILDAHHAAVEAIKSVLPDVPVGLTMASQDIVATKPSYEPDAQRLRQFMEGDFLSGIGRSHDRDDFVGVQSYVHTRIGEKPNGSIGTLKPDRKARILMMGYEFAPDSLEACLRNTHEITGLPLYVTECGIGTDSDEERIEYFGRAIAGVARCVRDGLPVDSFVAWSLLDNWEWEYGYRPRFGVVDVDRASQARTPKQSAHWLGQVAAHNSVTLLEGGGAR